MRRDADTTAFRGACLEAARGLGARVETPDLPFMSSFHAVTITGRGAARTVLRHADRPLVAFTLAPPVPGPPVSGFVDPPAWAAVFEAIGLRSLSVRELGTPLSQVDERELAEAADDIRYWRPEVLSDLLFNWWD
ncbi:hypothetical protein [Streptomyces resistomycificus]|uniref:hypothetical protein n=1 Tax=Streptomyces resistomycificus TaxID=67356 RepID=UPI000690E8F1|nr:hypothetical protein [Streptomyces resistomycificus]KUN92301.1 hypothetical protein AQJ84_32955 [Streptomyces resistomycificus]